jgi:hypothetical protein
MDYEKLIGGAGSESADFGSMLLGQRVTIDKFVEWTTQYDVAGIFSMPDVSDFSDIDVVCAAPRVNLLTDYRKVSWESVLEYQRFVTLYLSDADVESSLWVRKKLDNSVDDTLLVQIKQRFDKLPKAQRGGITLWKLLVDTLYENSFENKTLIVNYLTDHKLSDTPGHDVSISSSCNVAATRSLDERDLPSDIVDRYLKSMLDCSVEEFVDVVRAFKGMVQTQDKSKVDAIAQLDLISAKLVAKYRSLLKLKQWIGVGAKDSAFSSTIKRTPPTSVARNPTPRRPQLQPGQELRKPNPTWQAWFDRQSCEKCGNNHPTKHHDDPGIRDREWVFTPGNNNRRFTSTSTNRSPRPQQRSPRFKPGGKKDFQKKVHNAWLECVEAEDHDLFANLAGDDEDTTEEPEMFANVAGGAEGKDADDDFDGEDDEDGIFKALAVAGLDSLNWKAA